MHDVIVISTLKVYNRVHVATTKESVARHYSAWNGVWPLRNGDPTWPEDRFLSLFVHRRREMAHPGLTKGSARSSHVTWAQG